VFLAAADRVNWLYEIRADGLLPYGSYNGTEGQGTVGLATIEVSFFWLKVIEVFL